MTPQQAETVARLTYERSKASGDSRAAVERHKRAWIMAKAAWESDAARRLYEASMGTAEYLSKLVAEGRARD